MEKGVEDRANGHANSVSGEKRGNETESALMEDYIKRTTPQALLEHMKLYGCFDQLRSALAKELVDSGVQARLQERARAAVESTRAYVHAPPFDPAMPTTKRLQHRKALLSRILEELHRTPLNRDIEKGIQGVVQDPSSAFHELAHAQINEALESMRASTGKRKDSETPARGSSLSRPSVSSESEVVKGTPSQLLDEMLGAGRRRTEVDGRARSSNEADAPTAKRKRSSDGDGGADDALPSAENRGKAGSKDEGASTSQSRQLDQQRNLGKRHKKEHDQGGHKQQGLLDTGRATALGGREPSDEESSDDSDSSEDDSSSVSSSPTSSRPSSPPAKPSRDDHQSSSDDDDDESSNDEKVDADDAKRRDMNVEEDSDDERSSSKGRGRQRSGRKVRTIRKASSSSSSSASSGDETERKRKDNSSEDEGEEEDAGPRRRGSRTSLSSRRRREPGGAESGKRAGSRRKAKRRGSDARSTEEEDAALARKLAEEESARLYPLRRRASRGR